MGLKDRYDERAMKKIAGKFLRQYDYANRVLFATFADEIDKQFTPESEESINQKLLLGVAINELLGNPTKELKFTSSQHQYVQENAETVDQFKHEIMESQPDIREFVVQTARMLFFLDMMATTDSEQFLDSPQGVALKEVLSQYGGELPQVNPSMYDRICESVAKKTNTSKEYRKILKGKSI